MLEQRIYRINPIVVNDIRVNQVVIDPHYELKHSRGINDALILDLVKKLNGRHEFPQSTRGRYSYFATLIEYGKKQYRLIWLLEKNVIYIGVVNAYRDERRS